MRTSGLLPPSSPSFRTCARPYGYSGTAVHRTTVATGAHNECLQLHGGYGFMMEYPIARAYVDARVQRIYGGTNEIMKEVISRSLGLNKA